MATVHQDCSFALRELLLLTNLPRYFQISFPRKQEGSPKGALSSNHSHIGLLSKNKQKGKGKWLSRVRLFVTQSLEFPRPEYWSGQLFPSPGDLPNPGIKPRSPTLQADSLPAEPQGKPPKSKTSSCYHDILTDIHTHTHTLLHSFKYCVGQKVHWVFHKTIWRHLNEFLTNPIFKPLRSIKVFTAILRVAYPGTELLYFMEVNRGSSRYPQRATGKYFSFVAGQSLSQLFNATTDAGMQPQTIQRCGSEYDHV